MKTINSIIFYNRITDLFVLLISCILFVLYLIHYNKYYFKFSLNTKAIITSFILLSVILIVRSIHFILKYGFDNDLSIMNSNVGDYLSVIIFYILSYGDFKKFLDSVERKKNIIFLIFSVLILMVGMQFKGEGTNNALWLWGEYIFTFMLLTLSTFNGAKTLRFNWFSRFFYFLIIVTYIGNILAFYSFIAKQFGLIDLNSFIVLVSEIMLVMSLILLLIVSILVLRKKQ